MWPGVSHPQKTSDLKWVYGPISRKEWRWWVGRCELASGNPRFVVTSLDRQTIAKQALYEELYCARGDMENREALHVPVVRCRDLTDERSVVLA